MTAAVRSTVAGPGAPVNRLYVVAAWVPRRTTIAVGALGSVTFARGWHAYVGSARRGREARVARHMRPHKPLRWHADHLFAAFPATRTWLVDTPLSECELVEALCATGFASRAEPRFGAGDCRCRGHLLRLTASPGTGAGSGAIAAATRNVDGPKTRE